MTTKGRSGLALIGAATLVFMSVGPALAQQQQGNGTTGGRRGMRMFGGMGGMRGGGMFLLRNKSVQTELGMTQPQILKLQDSMQQFRFGRRNNNAAGGGAPGFGGQPGQPPDEKAFQQRMQEMQTQEQKTIAEVLDTKQQKRFAEIRLQQQGPRALADKTIAAKLKLTTDQSTMIQKILQAQRQQIQKAMQSMDPQSMTDDDRTKMMAKFQAFQKIVSDKMLEVLTPAQKTQWKAMLGKPFTIVQEAMPGGRGPGGGPGFGGRGGGFGGGPGGGGPSNDASDAPPAN
jgi:hypothetical protein